MLVRPTPGLRLAYLESYRAFRGAEQPGASLVKGWRLENPDVFRRWVRLLRAEEFVARPGLVRSAQFWVVERGEVVGSIQLRLELTDALKRRGGHVGYSIRPDRRRRGYAARALYDVKRLARRRGLRRLLVTCDKTNAGSRAVIEKNGGRPAVELDQGEGDPTARFWIEL